MNRKPEHIIITIEGMPELIKILSNGFSNINKKLDNMAKTQAELAQDLRDLGVELGKIGTETTSLLDKVTTLEKALADAGNVTPELQEAFDAVKAQAEVVDGLVPDAPQP